MTKNIIKEIIIMLLLTLAIILVLGVLLYEYVPANKIVPEKVSYTTPEEVKKELETVTDSDDDEQYFDYHIDSTQIKNYQKIQEYVPGRKNPFGDLDSEETSTATSETNKDNENTSNKEGTSNKENNSSTTTEESKGYLPDKGTK